MNMSGAKYLQTLTMMSTTQHPPPSVVRLVRLVLEEALAAQCPIRQHRRPLLTGQSAVSFLLTLVGTLLGLQIRPAPEPLVTRANLLDILHILP